MDLDQGDICVDHWLELDAPARIADVIRQHAPEVKLRLSRVGEGGPDCLSTRDIWFDVFESETIPVRKLGRTMGPYYAELGGYLVPGEAKPRDHHWLAVGSGLTLFDPTWGRHFREYGPPTTERYITDDGQPFEDWRRRELRSEHRRG